MNRMRIRIGTRVREYSLSDGARSDINTTEEALERHLHQDYALGAFVLEYLGEYAWDIVVDGRKVGHAKAWHEDPPKRATPDPTWWNVLVIAFFAYLALC